MNATIKRRWTTALRSGEYRQGRENLRVEAGAGRPPLYCCLGVLADLLDPDGWEEDNLHRGMDATLSPRVLEEVGLASADQDRLIELNDECRASFEIIADWIDARL